MTNNELKLFLEKKKLEEKIKTYKSLLKKIIKATNIGSLHAVYSPEADCYESNEYLIFNNHAVDYLTEEEYQLFEQSKPSKKKEKKQ